VLGGKTQGCEALDGSRIHVRTMIQEKADHIEVPSKSAADEGCLTILVFRVHSGPMPEKRLYHFEPAAGCRGDERRLAIAGRQIDVSASLYQKVHHLAPAFERRKVQGRPAHPVPLVGTQTLIQKRNDLLDVARVRRASESVGRPFLEPAMADYERCRYADAHQESGTDFPRYH